MRKSLSITLLSGLLAFAGPVLADANAEVKAAYAKFIQATSFRAEMTDMDTGKRVNRIEFVAPDRFAIIMEGGLRQVIIGRTIHMDLNGRTMSIPLPESVDPAQYRNQKALDDLSAGVTVTRRADSGAAGEPARVYHFVSQHEGQPVESLTFVSKASGLPIQVQTSGPQEKGKYRYQIRYSDFNDPSIVVQAPK